MTSTKDRTISRGDSGALIGFCIAGALIAAYITVFSIIRIIELARGVDVPVLVEFVGSTAPVELPLSTGDSITVGLDSAIITAPQLPAIAAVPGIIGQVAQILTIVLVIGCLILLARSVLTGRVFSRRNTALVATAGIAGLVGFATVRFFDNMLANATVARITDNGVDNAVISVEPFTFVLGAFVLALISTVFVIGDRLQRDTDGLV
ncbi:MULTISPECIES: DUF2975 domain-containing protein [unclassified Microbacterium]|uniref:DUF2975 domain-containing protein n=1 Tax=unclassified Microbacterium TaxID=2609290 RepID=UPI0006FB8F2B|nr:MULTISPECIES: DUF2975 domain-containing protein [unclassified Microbacterium]KRD50469.1 hypothetical protein ASE34_13000 [Microbacterium sp. Root280D1]CAH0257591.1 hypothetical protein SRABI98_03418 [Microbacterium sp. Bi98]